MYWKRIKNKPNITSTSDLKNDKWNQQSYNKIYKPYESSVILTIASKAGPGLEYGDKASSSPAILCTPSLRYLDMISKELEQLERTAEEQRLLRMDREERRQREYTRKKLNLRRKIEEVRRDYKCCEGKIHSFSIRK